jgi:hypothetical protein
MREVLSDCEEMPADFSELLRNIREVLAKFNSC